MNRGPGSQKRTGLSLWVCRLLLHQTSLLEGDVGAALLHGLEALGGDEYLDLAAEFREEYGLGLHIDLATAFAGGVKFAGTDAVGIPAPDDRFLTRDCADA